MDRSKEWWLIHDNEYIHYLYKITNLVTGKYYYGIHSIRKTNKRSNNLENDGYWGSGVDIERDIATLGKNSFKKSVIKTFSTREEAIKYEAEIVNKNTVLDPMSYNRVLGGGGNPTGMMAAVVKSSGKSVMIDPEEYKSNKDLYTTGMSGKVTVLLKSNNTIKTISIEEFVQNRDNYSTFGEGYSLYKKSSDWTIVMQLSTQDERVLSGEFIPIMKGTKQSVSAILNKTGEKNGMYKKVWITNGIENKIISESDTIPDDWKRGRLVEKGQGKGRRLYINPETLEEVFVYEEELVPDGFLPSFLFDLNKNLITFSRLSEIHDLCGDWDRARKFDSSFPSSGTIHKIVEYYKKDGKFLAKSSKH